MIDCGLKGKVILITGANNPLGIGAAAARAFARQGARVAVTFLRLPHEAAETAASPIPEPGMPYYRTLRGRSAEAVVREIQAAGGEAAAREADLADVDTPSLLFDWVEAVLGPVDVLVNNAAHYEEPDSIFSATGAALDRTCAVNTRAAVLLTAEYVRRYQQHGLSSGRVINLSTDAAQSFPGQIAYGASKAAMEAFTRGIAMEVGPLGITVNTVAPGPVQTGYISHELEAAVVPTIPLRRIGTPDDIADVLVFLASDQARWMTGQVLKVSGGHAL